MLNTLAIPKMAGEQQLRSNLDSFGTRKSESPFGQAWKRFLEVKRNQSLGTGPSMGWGGRSRIQAMARKVTLMKITVSMGLQEINIKVTKINYMLRVSIRLFTFEVVCFNSAKLVCFSI